MRRRYLVILIPFAVLARWRVVPFHDAADLYGFRRHDDRDEKKPIAGQSVRRCTARRGLGLKVKSESSNRLMLRRMSLNSCALLMILHLSVAPGLFDKLFARLGWTRPEPKTEAERVGKATSVLINGLEVQRIGQSYMIRIDFHSDNPEQAVKVANAMIDGYIFDQLNAKYQANRRAGDWLQERLQALREQTAVAERAVIEFKAKNNIVAAGGTLMNDKQLGEMTWQLATARAHTSDVQARLKRIDAVRPSYRQEQPASATDEIVSEAMSNAIINKLQSQYLDLVESSG